VGPAIAATGLVSALSEALAPWRKPSAVHDPAKVVLDLAITLALGGTASPTSPCCCAPSPASTDWWPLTRRSRGPSTPSR